MKIENICHNCLFIETEDLRIVADLWLDGASYCGQRHLFPKPLNGEKMICLI